MRQQLGSGEAARDHERLGQVRVLASVGHRQDLAGGFACGKSPRVPVVANPYNPGVIYWGRTVSYNAAEALCLACWKPRCGIVWAR